MHTQTKSAQAENGEEYGSPHMEDDVQIGLDTNRFYLLRIDVIPAK
jgi:hypothetical protein